MEADLKEMDPISILALFKQFHDAHGSIGFHKEIATCQTLYFMKKRASSWLEARLSPTKSRATDLHDETLSS